MNKNRKLIIANLAVMFEEDHKNKLANECKRNYIRKKVKTSQKSSDLASESKIKPWSCVRENKHVQNEQMRWVFCKRTVTQRKNEALLSRK